jgi:digeranylgeranylglycerophospholipid reductase
VGAGPAGSIAAMNAAERGAKTLILEKEKLPRFKLCGGAIPKLVINDLKIPREIIKREYKVASFFTPPNYERHDKKLSNIRYFGVNRDSFDYYLTKKALDVGVKLEETSKVTAVIKKGGQTKGVVTSLGHKYLADVVIACDGALSRISRKCGMWAKWFTNEGIKWQDQMALCIGIELRMEESIIDTKFENSFLFFKGRDFAPTGYAWIFPKRNRVSIGLGSMFRSLKNSPTEYLRTFLRFNPKMEELLKGGEILQTKGGWIPIRTPYRPSYDSGLLIVGDAASMVSKISGEGIYYAIRAGMNAGITAAEAVNEGDFSAEFLSKYQDRWELSIGITLKFQNQIYQEDELHYGIPRFHM